MMVVMAVRPLFMVLPVVIVWVVEEGLVVMAGLIPVLLA